MFIRTSLVLAAACVLALKRDEESPAGFHLSAVDWDEVQGQFDHPIELATKDFSKENPHMENQILDEALREEHELDVDREAFVKNMAVLRDEAFAQVVTGHSKQSEGDLVPKLRKIIV